MFKIASLISTVFVVTIFAGGSGNSFGGYISSEKYGDSKTGKDFIEIPNTSKNGCNENIKVYTYSKVRSRNWFNIIHDWHDGYATSTAKQCGKEVSVYEMVIQQYLHHSTMNIITKEAKVYNKSYLKMGLKQPDIEGQNVHTVHGVKHGRELISNLYNDWAGLIAEYKKNDIVDIDF